MRSNTRYLIVVLGVGAAAAVTSACKKSAETDAKETDHASIHPEPQVNPAEQGVGEPPNDYLAAVRREQLELRAKVQAEIETIDKDLHGLRSDSDPAAILKGRDAKRAQELLDRRARLELDLQRISVSDERGWDETKAEIEHDLSGDKRPITPNKI